MVPLVCPSIYLLFIQAAKLESHYLSINSVLPGDESPDEASENLLRALFIFLRDGGLFCNGEAIETSHSLSESSSSSLNFGRAGRFGALQAVEVLVESGEKFKVLELSVELLYSESGDSEELESLPLGGGVKSLPNIVVV